MVKNSMGKCTLMNEPELGAEPLYCILKLGQGVLGFFHKVARIKFRCLAFRVVYWIMRGKTQKYLATWALLKPKRL